MCQGVYESNYLENIEVNGAFQKYNKMKNDFIDVNLHESDF
jgi:hypothetical protein